MNILRFALLLVAMNLFASFAVAETSMGRIAGIVTDINNARIHGATVAVTSAGATRTTTTNEEGAYELDLPSGIYRIAVTSVGFCPSRRAAFRITPAATPTFNFTLLPCPVTNDLRVVEGQYKGETDRYRDPFKQEVFPIKRAKGTSLELMVRYGARKREGKFLEYSGTVVTYDEHAQTSTGYTQSQKSIGVTATLDWIRIQADKLRLDPRTLRLEATGNVILEDGKRQTRATVIEVRFSNSKPMIEVIK